MMVALVAKYRLFRPNADAVELQTRVQYVMVITAPPNLIKHLSHV